MATECTMTVRFQPTCAVIHPGGTYTGKQAFTYFAGVSADNCGARGIGMHLLTIPPQGRAKAHLHESHETAIHIISGAAALWYGEKLEEHLDCQAGDYVCVPAGVPHLPYNPSATEACTAVIARTDPNEQESVVLRPDLDALH